MDVRRLLCLLVLLVLLVPAAHAEDVYYVDGKTADRVHLRAGASVNAASLGLYFTGTEVTVLEWSWDWAYVQIGAESGWISTDYLSAWAMGESLWYEVNNPYSTWVNLRLMPSEQGPVLSCPDNGTPVLLLGETADGWSYVSCGGMNGYIMTGLLSASQETPLPQQTTLLAEQGAGNYVHCYMPPEGAPLYFTAAVPDPVISMEDVNFDGLEDIVIMTASGASNAFYEFFVYDPAAGTYVYADHPGAADGLCNYVLYPEYGIVATHANNGSAGAEHEDCLFRWQGTDMQKIRSAVSQVLVVSASDDYTHTQTTYFEFIHIAVRNHEWGSYDDCVVWEKEISIQEAVERDLFTVEKNVLWQGIR